MGKKSGIRETDEKRAGCGILAKKGRECGIRTPPFQTLRDASALSGVNEGIQMGGHLIKTVRFADDQATLASSVKGLQLMMGKMQESAGEYDMKINVKKTKVKKICKRPGKEFTIFLEGKQLSQESSHFNYLGSLIRSRMARKRVY